MGAPPFNLRSAIGDWRLAILTLGAGSTRAATNAPIDPNEIPPLRPAKPEILPGFWEEHGLLVAVTGLVVILVVILLWRILARPKPPLIPAPAAVARQALEPLRGRGEDAPLFTQISLILRRYFVTAFQLPGNEFTNRELCQQLARHPKTGSALSTAATELLEGMEHRRFNAVAARQRGTGVPPVSHLKGTNPATSDPVQTAAPGGTEDEEVGGRAGCLCYASTVEVALALIDQAEARLHPPSAPAEPATATA